MELLLRRVADIDGSLLITGESGVGKEVAARFVHQVSTRAKEPFVAVNCAAIPRDLVESHLFGHERGSFTSAQARHRGHVERAGNGILFLDEVGDLPMPTQAKLLRLIEERAFTRVGGEATIKTGARITCAANTSLEAAVGERRFREDLYFRINVIRVAIPRLCDLSDDILPLAQLFMRKFSEAFDRDVHGFTPEAEQALLEYPWPGNVRELRNRVERAVALSPAQRIAVEALFPADSFPTLAEIRDRAERQHIRAALAAADGVEEAAKQGGGMLSRNLEKSLHRALACANERRHEYATLEHLLLSLTEDQDAVAVLRACGVELDRLRREVLNYVDNELANLVAAHTDDAKPTASFQRVLQRAAIHVQSSGREEVTGANVLVAMFAERESHAVSFLLEQDMTRFDAVNYISHGIAKAPGRSETQRDVNRTSFSQRLELRQSQSLVMTPQLQQAIKMLQFSNRELNDFIDNEIKQNPFLERQEIELGKAGPADDTGAEEQPSPADLPRDLLLDAAGFGWGEKRDRPVDFGGERPTATRTRTLREHLLEQIGADLSDQSDRIIAVHLLDLLDEAGYLRTPLDGVAQLLGCEVARIEAVLARLQQFDPAGVFARDLKECLAPQLRDRNRFDPAMQALLDNLPLVAARNIAALVRVCGVDEADVADMVAEIKSLDPRPGLAFDPPPAQPAAPDILMRAQPEGGWSIELNTETLPHVLVNDGYYAQVSQTTRSKAEKDYLTERLHAANWLVKSLHQRAATILKVAAEIVRQQDAFLHHGVSSLRPLIPRDIADAIGMHERITRAISNKCMATPRGVYALKYFFTPAMPASGGNGTHSADPVRRRIRGLIDGEAPDHPLSDERVVELLRHDRAAGAGMRSPFPSGRATPLIDETKIIAAILCGQTIVADTETDPVKKVVDIYERILAELRSRGHGSPSK